MNGDAPERVEEWKVYFDGSFWGHHGRERAGREVPVQKWFSWAGRDWFVPSVYLCAKGIVIDFCMRAEASALRGFMKKWGIDPESDESINFTRDEREQMEREHPLSLGFPHEPRLRRHFPAGAARLLCRRGARHGALRP